MDDLWAERGVEGDAAVERVRACELGEGEFEERFVAANVPVVLEGGMGLDPAPAEGVARFSPAALAREMGGRTVRNVFVSRASGRFLYFAGAPPDPNAMARRAMPFAEFVERASGRSAAAPVLGEGERLYLYGEPMPEELAGCVPPLPPVLRGAVPEEALTSRLLWVAANGSCSPLHYDLSEGLLGQLHGSKRFLLFRHRFGGEFYDHPAGHAHDRQSRVDSAVRPDTDRFPLFAGVPAAQAVVRAGDAIFIPYGWYHQVESEGESVSVTYRWNPHENALRAAALGGALAGLPPPAAAMVRDRLLDALPPHVAAVARKRDRMKQ